MQLKALVELFTDNLERLLQSNVILKPLKALEVFSGNVRESMQCCITRRQVLIQLVCNLKWEWGLTIQATM